MRDKSNFSISFNLTEQKLWEQRQMKTHELLCDCGQPLNPEGVCISCNPPEEEGKEMLEREAHDPKPLNFDKEKEVQYEEDLDVTMIDWNEDDEMFDYLDEY